VRLTLKVVMQNDRDFVDVILLCFGWYVFATVESSLRTYLLNCTASVILSVLFNDTVNR
jgi:hypothetical protein